MSNDHALKIFDFRRLIHGFAELIERIYYRLDFSWIEDAASYQIQQPRVGFPRIHELAQDFPVIEHHIEVRDRQGRKIENETQVYADSVGFDCAS
jgi:hypothetical protein